MITRSQRPAVCFEVYPRLVQPARFKQAAGLCRQGRGCTQSFQTHCKPKNVGFQTGHQNARFSHTIDRSAFPPSENTQLESSPLNGGAQRLNGACLPPIREQFCDLEVFHG
jgi:hypothetical protein